MPIPSFSPMVGTSVKASILFVDDLGVATDPTTITITFRRPDSTTEVNPGIVHVGVGIYTAQFIVDIKGTWVVQAYGEGAVAVVEEEEFEVRHNIIPL